MIRLATSLSMFLLCAACSQVQRNSGSESNLLDLASFETIRHQQVIKLKDEQELEISNPFGDLQVRKGAVGTLEINLFVQRPKGSKTEASLSQTAKQEGLVIQIKSGEDGSVSDLLRVDAVVMVPPSPNLRLSTDHGTIDARKLTNPLVVAASRTGELRLTATSVMQASTKYGNIRAAVMQPEWNGESRFSSEAGQIQVTLPLSPNLHLRAHAGKGITSEFSLDIVEGETHFDAEFTSGDGTDAILVESTQGQVKLFSLVFDPRIYGPPSITTPQAKKDDSIGAEHD